MYTKQFVQFKLEVTEVFKISSNPSEKDILLSFDQDTLRLLRSKAKERNISVNDYINELINKGLTKFN